MLFIALTFIINVIDIVITEPRTCSSLIGLNYTTYQHCSYQPDENGNTNSSVRCDVLSTIGDFGEYVDHTFYLHMKFLFEVIEPIDSTTLCMRLSSFEVDKVTARKPWDNATIANLFSNFYTLLRFINDGFVKSKFKNIYPSALLELDDKCTQRNVTCNPILEVNFLSQLEQPQGQNATDFFSGPYWQKVKNWYHDLGGYDTQVRFDFDPQFGTIKPQFISPIISNIDLTYLRLTTGKWGQLNTTLLKNMTSLKILDFSSNEINSTSNDTFLETPELEVLILADNLLTEVPAGITNLAMLKHLDLSNNDIENKDSFKIITKLSSLKTLSLSGITFNDLDNLEPVLRNCNVNELQLEILNLSYCSIHVLNGQDFQCQKNLKIIDLSHNKLREIPSEIASVQKNLTTLNISSNLISKGPNLILHNNVTLLDMSNNKLNDLSNIIAKGQVGFLDLSRNNISSWSDEHLFDGKVKNLNLSDNSINYASKQMIDSFKSLKTIDLGENLYDCLDCSLPGFQKWLKEENSTFRVHNVGRNNQLTCSIPAADRGRYIVDIDFDISLCLTNYSIVAGVPVAVILLVAMISVVVAYYYRFEITYMGHLISLKKNSARLINSNETYKYDAFVCYSGEDRSWVLGELLPTLESKPYKYKLCLHERDFPLGSFIVQNILSSLETSKNTIMVLSNNFIKSEWCQWELELANRRLFEERQEFLILIELERLDRSLLPRHLKYVMDTRTYLEWPQNNQNVERAWKRLRDALGPSIHNGSTNNELSVILD